MTKQELIELLLGQWQINTRFRGKVIDNTREAPLTSGWEHVQ